ncbi:MAG: 4-(cytidine 5'-diphospho)-2-C-methyl-D-erythritol kinase [Candidatus Omnitrophica bacterium]|nr:4-(cytidine 5'-diphospho)-2-C-methyl-D-erythritol kinase [Candidatus Omnitrophota bacterium]
MQTLTVEAPAKVNLYLRVVGKRPDGYHTLETVLERVDLADELTLTKRPRGLRLICDDRRLPTGPGNLIVRAARALEELVGARLGAAVRLRKRIPIAAGLGGGSSDAAATLLGLRRLYDLPVTDDELVAVGRRLGCDVPFFLTQAKAAWATERGDLCETLPANGLRLWHVLATPRATLLTKAVYQTGRFARPARPATAHRWAHLVRDDGPAQIGEALFNSLEPAAATLCPVTRQMKVLLLTSGCVGACLSGSGPTVFGLAADHQAAKRIAERVRAQHPSWRVAVARTV